MTTPNNATLHELLAFLQDSELTELNELAEKLVAEESRVFEEKIKEAHDAEKHSVVISLETDWDFFMVEANGSDCFTKTFRGKSKAEAISCLERYFLDNANYDNLKLHKEKIEVFQRGCLPEILSQLQTSDYASTGANWEVDAHYSAPKEIEHPICRLEFKLLGVTLSTREYTPTQD